MLPVPDSSAGPTVPVPYLSLADLPTAWVAPPGTATAPLYLDCSALPYQCTLGVCHQVSQLLLLRRAGVRFCLHRVNPVLAHSLHTLKIEHLFAWAA